MIKSNKYLCGLAVALASLTLLACNGCGGSSNVVPATTEYQFTSYNNAASSSGCMRGVQENQCRASSSTITFNVSYETIPASYLVIPLQLSLPRGLTISQTGTCSTSPVANYACSFTLVAQNVASGTIVNIPLNGSLGQQSFYSVTYQ